MQYINIINASFFSMCMVKLKIIIEIGESKQSFAGGGWVNLLLNHHFLIETKVISPTGKKTFNTLNSIQLQWISMQVSFLPLINKCCRGIWCLCLCLWVSFDSRQVPEVFLERFLVVGWHYLNPRANRDCVTQGHPDGFVPKMGLEPTSPGL